ncbi:MAG: hypothetical protein P8X63_13415 [Desulfuromonadaceae bacterium]
MKSHVLFSTVFCGFFLSSCIHFDGKEPCREVFLQLETGNPEIYSVQINDYSEPLSVHNEGSGLYKFIFPGLWYSRGLVMPIKNTYDIEKFLVVYKLGKPYKHLSAKDFLELPTNTKGFYILKPEAI